MRSVGANEATEKQAQKTRSIFLETENKLPIQSAPKAALLQLYKVGFARQRASLKTHLLIRLK